MPKTNFHHTKNNSNLTYLTLSQRYQFIASHIPTQNGQENGIRLTLMITPRAADLDTNISGHHKFLKPHFNSNLNNCASAFNE